MALETEKEHLFNLAQEADGVLTVDAVLADAEDESSPLHKHFVWDNNKAAHEYRRWQARALIAKCRIAVESKADVQVRAFVSLPSDRQQEGGGYRFRLDVMNDDGQKAELLRDMKTRVLYWSKQAMLLDKKTQHTLRKFAEAVNQNSEITSRELV